MKRCFKSFDSEVFCNEVRKISWFDLYMCDDVTEAANYLINTLTCILDKMAPVKKIQVRKKYAPWLSKETKEIIRRRDEAQSKAARSREQDDFRLYKNLRNTVANRIKLEKKKWEKDKLDSATNDPGALWGNVKTWLGWGNHGPPNRLFHGGRMMSSPSDLSRTMNSF